MTHNIIIGKKSVLSNALKKDIKNITILSANSTEIFKTLKFFENKKINLIFNNFYPANKLNKLNKSSYDTLNNLALKLTGNILNFLKISQIQKIIYTSSSSVYSIPNNIKNLDHDEINRNLQASYKLTAEALINNFCKKNNIKFYIMRVFNTYGDERCDFSFIEKAIRLKKNNNKIHLINGGNSLRDFINLKDIARIYKLFLEKDYKSGIYDLGTGKGYFIKDIVSYLKFKSNKIKHLKKIRENNFSIADISKINQILPNFKFLSLEKYLNKKCKIKSRKPIKYSLLKKSHNLLVSGNIIYGAGFAGRAILSELRNNGEDVLYFVDDNPKLINTIVNGVNVISFSDLLEFKKNIDIKRVYLSIPSLGQLKLELILNKLKKNFFDVRFLPQKKYLLSDKLDLNDFTLNEINYLLKRKQVTPKKIFGLTKKIVLVTGAGGSIGSEICRQLILQKAKRVICLDHSELAIYNLKKKLKNECKYYLGDMNDNFFVENLIKIHKVNLIIHAGAYKHVNILQDNVMSAVKNNILGTVTLCNLSIKFKTDFLLISTDKAAQPKSMLGYTKKISEMYCEYLGSFRNDKKFINIVRFGNVFGSSGSAISNFLDQINNNLKITVTDKRATRYFMTIIEACYLVLQTTASKQKNKTFVLNMGKPLNIYKLAEYFAKLKSKINPNYKFEIIETGLGKEEKLHENLFEKLEKKIINNKNITIIKKKKYNKSTFEQKFNTLINLYEQHEVTKLANFIKKFK